MRSNVELFTVLTKCPVAVTDVEECARVTIVKQAHYPLIVIRGIVVFAATSISEAQ